MRTAAGVPSTSVQWTNAPIGAMGYNTEFQSMLQGGIKRQIAGTDGAGAYWRETTGDLAAVHWTQCFQRGVGLDALFDMKPSIGESDGTWFIKFAPGDFDYIYAHWKHRFVRSRDGGRTWTLCTAIPQMKANSNLQANGSYGRLCYCKAAVDGLDKNVVYWGVQNDGAGTPTYIGLLVTADGGDSYAQHADIPVPSHATTDKRYILVAVDTNSAAAANGRNSVVAVVSPGNGLYVSTDGGVSFALADATVTDVYNIKFAPDGKLWIMLQQGGQNLKTFTIGGSLSALFGPTNDVRDVEWDPLDATIIYTLKFFYKSTDNGSTWIDVAGAATDPYFVTMLGHEAPLIAEVFNDDHSLTNNTLHHFDDKFWISTGYGPVYIDETNMRTAHKTTGPALTMEETVVGIEDIVPQVAHYDENGQVTVVNQDKSAIDLPMNGTFPQTCFPTSALVPGFDVDSVPGYKATLAGIGTPVHSPNNNWSGYNRGAGWFQFDTAPSTFVGGSICVIRDSEIAICTGNNGWPRYSKDNGVTWPDSTFSGFAKVTGTENGWGFANVSNDRRIICNEKDGDPDRTWIYNYGPGAYAAQVGLWESADGGANYTHVYADQIIDPIFRGNHELLEYCQGFLFLSAGEAGGDGGFGTPGATNTMFRCSTSDVTTWTALPDMLEVTFYCFGAPLVPGDFPTLYAYGWNGGVHGLFRSRNANASPASGVVWEQLSNHDEFASLAALAADPRDGHFGEGIAGFGGMSYRYWNYHDVAAGT